MNLFYFLLGFIFAQYILPIGDTAATLAMTWLEKAKAKVGVQLTQYNQEIQEISSMDIEKTPCVGFQYEESEYDYENDEDFSEKKKR